MVKYSLKEMLYWLTIWMICVSVLNVRTGTTLALVIATFWLGGTVFVGRHFGPSIGFLYAFLFGFLLFLAIGIATLIEFRMEARLASDYALIFAYSVGYGIAGGAIVWGVAVGVDKAFKRFIDAR